MRRRRYVQSAAIVSLLFSGPDPLHASRDDDLPVVRRRRRLPWWPG